MARSFSIVDHKIAEAEFFLKRISECGFDFFGVQCYVGAFTSSTRTITYAMQAALNGIDGFEEWYGDWRSELQNDRLARFFHKFRRINHHVGSTVVCGGSGGPNEPVRYWFQPIHDIPHVPGEDVETACKRYFISLLKRAYQCYIEFGSYIDAHQYCTAENFKRLGRTIDDAEEEILGTRGHTKLTGLPEEYAWQALRDAVTGCEIDDIFFQYLGMAVPKPARLPELKLEADDWSDLPDGGRVYIPRKFRKTGDLDRDLEIYRASLSEHLKK